MKVSRDNLLYEIENADLNLFRIYYRQACTTIELVHTQLKILRLALR